jgi:nitroimidazol reductase NimA-like FMN-containing flavoprotein (pyridoxamine 5'-phosphate oxidase superfamily)
MALRAPLKGQRKMRRTDRELKSKEELIDVLNDGKIIQIAFIDEHEPYIVTLNYGYRWNAGNIKFYFHSATEGRKIKCIKNSPNVCFTISICDPFVQGEKACNYGMKYRSVVGCGRMRIVENDEERILGLNVLMKQYTGKDTWVYDDDIMKKTVVSCLEVEKISGKRKK